MTAEKVQVLLVVAQRAPASQAEQIICEEVAAWMTALLVEQQAKAERKAAKAAKRTPPA